MRIKCPVCGERPLEEYSYRGDAGVKRPQSHETVDSDVWHDFVFIRDNPRGRLKEQWSHSGGCGAWLVVDRDTYTHEIFSVRLAKASKRGAK